MAALPLPLPCDMGYAALRAEAIDAVPVEQLYTFDTRKDFCGNGSYGQVYGADVLPDRQRKVALKVMNCYAYTRDRERALREPLLLRRATTLLPKHPNLLQLYSAHEQYVGSDKYTGMPLYTLAVATTFAPGGDLMSHIEKILASAPEGEFAKTFTEAFVARIVKTIASTVNELHNASLLHLDLKPENVLLRVPVNSVQGFEPERDLVLCDVGMMAYKQEVARENYVGRVHGHHQGTPTFSAPEQFHRPYSCCAASDAWSIGCITFGLLTWHNAFPQPPPPGYTVRMADVRGNLSVHARQAWDELTEEAHDFVARLLVVDPAARMTVSAMLSHPFLSRLDLPTASLSLGSTRSLSSTIRNASAASQGSQVMHVVAGVLQLAGTFMGALWSRAVSVVGEATGAGAGEGMSSSYPVNELERLRHAFYEKVGSRAGGVCLEEFRAIFRAAQVPLDDELVARNLFRLMDTDQSGTVSYMELEAGITSLSKGDESTLDFVFDMFDQDGSGNIDLVEMGKLAESTGIIARGQRSLAATVRAATAMSATGAGPASPGRPPAPLARAPSHSEAMSSAVAALQALFLRIDTNRDGKIDRMEFKEACEADNTLRETLLAPLKAIAAVHAQTVQAAQVEEMVAYLHAK